VGVEGVQVEGGQRRGGAREGGEGEWRRDGPLCAIARRKRASLAEPSRANPDWCTAGRAPVPCPNQVSPGSALGQVLCKGSRRTASLFMSSHFSRNASHLPPKGLPGRHSHFLGGERARPYSPSTAQGTDCGRKGLPGDSLFVLAFSCSLQCSSARGLFVHCL